MLNGKVHQIGIVSDTHGLLRPEMLRRLEACESIIHAGDVGKRDIIEALEQVAPVLAVRGNVDKDEWAGSLPRTQVVQVGDVQIYVLHDLALLDLDPAAAGFSAVVSGHSHKALIGYQKGVLYLNPGSVGPRRFSLPISLAYLYVKGKSVEAELVYLE